MCIVAVPAEKRSIIDYLAGVVNGNLTKMEPASSQRG
jgi:hypothetical protein